MVIYCRFGVAKDVKTHGFAEHEIQHYLSTNIDQQQISSKFYTKCLHCVH
uniref:Uncharacterized protein n=1 Tax=Tetranychus urticae TaxID=32264 RepID=T1K3G9_TETUR